jgi:hypothetical protein
MGDAVREDSCLAGTGTCHDEHWPEDVLDGLLLVGIRLDAGFRISLGHRH